MELETFFWLRKALLLFSRNFTSLHCLSSFTESPNCWLLASKHREGSCDPRPPDQGAPVLGRAMWVTWMVPTGRGLGGAMDPNRLAVFPFRVGLGELYSGALTFLSEVLMLSMCFFLTRIFQSKRPNLPDGGEQPHSSLLTLPVLGDEPRTSCTFPCCFIY